MAGATGAERFGARGEPLSVADLVREAKMLSAKENARDRRTLKSQGAWSGTSVFSLESEFDTRRGTRLPDATLRVSSPRGRPHAQGRLSEAYPAMAEAYPIARRESPRGAHAGRETRLYIVRLEEKRFFVGTFYSGSNTDADFQTLCARLDQHRVGDCQWTRKYPPLEDDEALYWYQESRDKEEVKQGQDDAFDNASDDASDASSNDALNALVERLMFEKHKRHGLDVVRGGGYNALNLQQHQKRRLYDVFFLKDEPACAVCGDKRHVSKWCVKRRDVVDKYTKWRKVFCDGDEALSETDSECGLETASETSSISGNAFAKETVAFLSGNDQRSSATTLNSKAGRSAGTHGGEKVLLKKKWTEAEEFDLLKALHAGFAGPQEITQLARDRGRTEQDVLSRIKILRKRV